MDEPHNRAPRMAPPPMRPGASPLGTRVDQCPKHGPYTSTCFLSGYWSPCPACVDAERAQQAAAEAARAVQRRIERDAARLRAAGAIGRFEDADFENFKATTKEQRGVLTACRDFAEVAAAGGTAGAGLLLIGPPGTGKTHLLTAMVRRVVLARFPYTLHGGDDQREGIAEIITARDLVRSLRSTWRRDSKVTEEEAIESFQALDLLALDEVGASFGTEAEQMQLLDVIDARYRLRRPTVIASNLPLAGIKEAIGERAFDRLREGAKVLPCTWASHRGGAA